MPLRPLTRFGVDDAALVLVDVQNDFCHEDGTAAAAGLDVSAMSQATDRMIEVIEAGRRVGIPVVFVRTTHDPIVDSVIWTHRTAASIDRSSRGSTPNCVTGTWGAEFFRIAPREDEAVVLKHRYSGFAGTNLDNVLRAHNRRALIFAGFTTNVCVESTLRDGLSLDYLVSIVGDACAAFDPREHAASLAGIDRYFGKVTDSATLIDEWNEG